DVEAEAEAAVVRVRDGALEPAEDADAILLGDADAAVAHGDLDGVVARAHLDVDGRARAVLERVAHEVVQGAIELGAVPRADGRRTEAEVQRAAALGRTRAHPLGDVLDEV